MVGLVWCGDWKGKRKTPGVLGWVLGGLVFEGPTCNILNTQPIGRILNIPTSVSQRNSYEHWEIIRPCQCQASYYIATTIRTVYTWVQTIESMRFNFLWLFTFHFTCSTQKLLWYVGRFKEERAIKFHSSKKTRHRAWRTVMVYTPFYLFFPWPLQILSYLPSQLRYFSFNDYLIFLLVLVLK